MSHRAAAAVGPGSVRFLPEKPSQIDICGLVFAAWACCICPQILGLFGVGDPQNLFAEMGQRWVHLSLPGEWGASLGFRMDTTLESPEIFVFLPFSFLNNIGRVFFVFDLKDPKNICPHQSFIYFPHGEHSPRVTQTHKA